MIKGHSSFVVEMMELRTILRNVDNRTLILGDELSKGSEITAATALTVTTIEYLINKGATFIFSTHLQFTPLRIVRIGKRV
jgi:DNA mismatch repair protein MutS